MSAPRKKWEDHSPRWIRKAQREGLTKARWNAWLKLEKETRKQTDARRYASGESVAKQLRTKNEREAYARMRAAYGPAANPMTISKNVRLMSTAELRWTARASQKDLRAKSSQRPTRTYDQNLWWYH